MVGNQFTYARQLNQESLVFTLTGLTSRSSQLTMPLINTYHAKNSLYIHIYLIN